MIILGNHPVRGQHPEHAAQLPRPPLVHLVNGLLGVALSLGDFVDSLDGEVVLYVGHPYLALCAISLPISTKKASAGYR